MNNDTRQREPMKDRTNEEGFDPVTDAPADDAGRRGMDESRHGEKNGTPQVRTMIEEILDRENIEIAWKKVRSNKGAPGIDGMTISDFPAFWQKEWPRISRAIMEGNDRLMDALREKIACRKTLGLLRRILTAGVVLPDGTLEATAIGVPQGGPLSPLLANIALDPLDKELESRGHKFARYADDFIILVKSAKAANRVMASVVRYCEGRLKLVVNRAKSRCTQLKFCEFLGYAMDRRGRLVWTQKALHRFKQRVREWERSGHRAPGGWPREGLSEAKSNHPSQPRTPSARRH